MIIVNNKVTLFWADGGSGSDQRLAGGGSMSLVGYQVDDGARTQSVGSLTVISSMGFTITP